MITILGFGLAGAWCARHLISAGERVRVIDPWDPTTSTRIAAGIIVPIAGQRCKPTWRIRELLPIARTSYPAAVWRDVEIVRVFRSEEQREEFYRQGAKGAYTGINVDEFQPDSLSMIQAPFGGFRSRDAAVVDLPEFLNDTRKLIEEHGEFVVGRFDAHSEAPPTITIYAMGWHIHDHPLWSWLKLEPSKGETIDVEPLEDLGSQVLSNGTWIVSSNGRHRVGATSVWWDLDPTPTAAGQQRLVDDYELLTGRRPRVLGHHAAIRPSTQFKRPMVGQHPDHPTAWICTGFGAKGTLFGPWAAQELVQSMLDGHRIDHDIDIAHLRT